MATVKIKQVEGHQMLCTSGPRGLVMDQEPERGGLGTGFRPTELFLMALGG